MDERRSEVRMLCADVVEVYWTDGAGEKRLSIGLLEDISQSGACLQLEGAVPIGSEVLWGPPKQRFSGVVRYCVYREIGYFVGVEFADGVKWSEDSFQPKHLLDVQELVRPPSRQEPEVEGGLTVQ